MPPAKSAPAAVSPFEALTNLSVGRTGADSEKAADIVHKGEIVHLTDEQAQRFMDPRRHRVPVIRAASEQNQPSPRITARDLFGSRPQAAQFGARPDPAGSSHVVEHPEAESADPADPRNGPEANDPVVDLSVDPDAVKDR
jgi:hypothetical protein